MGNVGLIFVTVVSEEEPVEVILPCAGCSQRQVAPGTAPN
jgi:hypothetical protein